MYIRCVACRSATWIGSESADPGGALCCSSCGHRHRPSAEGLERATGKPGYRQARELARRERIDVPAAYSVLLGLMTPQQARGEEAPAGGEAGAGNAPGDEGPRAEACEPPASSSQDPRARARWLVSTRRSASGNRLGADASRHDAPRANTAAISKLTERYGLRLELAREVVERRITLQQALQDQAAATSREQAAPAKPARRHVSGPRLLAAAALLLAATGATAYWGWLRWQDYVAAARAMDVPVLPPRVDQAPAPVPVRKPDPLARVEVVRSDEGTIREVRGPNPRTLLEGYCAAVRPVPCEPVELAATDPPHHEARWGIYRDFGNLSGLRAVRMRRDRSSRLWVVGDSRRPVPTFEAASIRIGEPRIDLWGGSATHGTAAPGERPAAGQPAPQTLNDVLPADLRDPQR